MPSRQEFLATTLELLGSVLPSDDAAWNAVDLVRGHSEAVGTLGADAAAGLIDVADDHPMVLSYLRDGPSPLPAPRRMSDVVSRRELRRTRAYGDLLRPHRAEYQLTILAAPTSARGGRFWTFNRADRDFTDEELDLARRLQPLMVALDRGYDALAAPQPLAPSSDAVDRYPTLTAREAQVLSCVARGLTAQATGHLLRISEPTVRKHLEHCYAKLDCSDRLVAVDRARRAGFIAP